MSNDRTNEVILTGLDGSNPLAFLAAMGTLRSLSLAWPQHDVKMAWRRECGAWRPVVDVGSACSDEIVATLTSLCQITQHHPTLNIADDLNIKWTEFRRHLLDQTVGQADSTDFEATSFAAAFGCEAIRDDNDVIVDTSLRTMSGAGHQHFLKTMRDVLSSVKPDQIERALFQPWKYDDPLKGMSLRFDPSDEKRYALRWDDPSGDPTRNSRGNMLGANAMAIMGIPYIKVAPVKGELHTTGFRGQFSRDCFWTWPIWDRPVDGRMVSSILAIAEMQDDKVSRGQLTPRGIVEVYRSQRITVGKFRNFTPAEPV